MQKQYLIFLFLLGLLILSWKDGYRPDKNISGKMKAAYLQEFKEFIGHVEQLNQTKNQKLTQDSIQQLMRLTRNQYKKIDLWTDYYDSLFVKFYVNGSPLSKAFDEALEPTLIPPEGLQIMDELVYSDDWMDDKFEFYEKAENLSLNIDSLYALHEAHSFDPRHFFIGARRTIIKVFTLGLTGFDTPGSLNVFEESIISLHSISDGLKKLSEKQQEDPVLKHTVSIIDEATIYLDECDDFDHFDHMYFYKNYLQPVYQLLKHLHKTFNLPFTDELTDLPQSTNYRSDYLFDKDFFGADYFSETHKRDISNERAELGKFLFFDPLLSVNNQRACASCHLPEKAFTDGKKKSDALNFKSTLKRNSPTVIDAVYADRFFWDLKVGRLSKQIETVVINQHEFKLDFAQISEKLKKSEDYEKMFREAYPSIGINSWSVGNALVNYIISLSSFNSPFDKYIRGESVFLDSDAIHGFNLFMGKAACATCHFPPAFNGSVPPLYIESESEVLGVPSDKDLTKAILDSDIGRYGNGRKMEFFENYKNSFKTVSLRNVALTAPYMHNGVFDNLEEVINFYNVGGGLGIGMDLPHQTLPGDSLHLTEKEQSQIISFLHTLTDTTGLTSKPMSLPESSVSEWNNRRVGGDY